MKKMFLMILSIVMLVSSAAFADGPLTAEQLARLFVPENATYLSTEKEDLGHLELHFLVAETGEFFDVELDEKTQMVYSVDSERQDDRGSNNIKLTEQDARAVVLAVYPDAVVDSVILSADDGLKYYKILFSTPLLYGQYEINPENGIVLERELNYLSSQAVVEAAAKAASTEFQIVPASVTDQDIVDGLIGQAKAEEIALAKAGDGRVVKIKKDQEDGRIVYEGEIHTATKEIEFEIDAKTGKVLDWDVERLDDD